MSSSLVRQSLQLVDNERDTIKDKHSKKKSLIKVPDKFIITGSIRKRGKKEKVKLLSSKVNFTVDDARRQLIEDDKKFEENIRKFKTLHSELKLPEETTSLLIERAITGRPVTTKTAKEKERESTVFTEEDFQKFEAEYFDD